MKTAIYARVSTDMQAEKGYSIEAQLDKLRAYCSLNDIEDFDEYVDGGYSASNLDRPEMKRLIQDIGLSLVDTVIVYKLDRLSRKTKDTLYLVEDIFTKNNVKFISLSESIDTSTSSGKFFLSILSSVAQLERENIKERGMFGMRKKAELGLKSRTPKLLVGYDYDEKNKKYLINDYEALQIKLIFDKYLENESIGNIFQLLKDNYTTKYGKWKTQKSVQNILDNETYIGNFVYQKNFIEGVNIPQIINKEIFEKVKKIREYKKSNYHRHTSEYLLTGLIYCGECGSRLRGYPKYDKSAVYYVCYGRDKSHPSMSKSTTCVLPYFRYEQLNDEILRSLKYIASNKSYFNSIVTKATVSESEIETLQREIKKLNEKANRIVDLLIEAEIDKDTFTAKLTDINKQKDILSTQLEDLKTKLQPRNIITHDKAKELIKSLYAATMPEKRIILSQLIARIILFKDKSINIEWRF